MLYMHMLFHKIFKKTRYIINLYRRNLTKTTLVNKNILDYFIILFSIQYGVDPNRLINKYFKLQKKNLNPNTEYI